MLTLTRSGFSCGVYQISGEMYYRDINVFMRDFNTIVNKGKGDLLSEMTQFIMSHRIDTDNGIGDAFEAYIEKHKLGTVVRSADAVNPLYGPLDKGGHKIAVWVWTRDVEAFNQHFKEKAEAQPQEKAA